QQSTSGVLAWRGLGAWDFGGNDGRCGEMRSDWVGPAPNVLPLSAPTRPYNIASAGADISGDSKFPEYGCPADAGVAQIAPNYVPGFSDQNPCTGDEVEDALSSSMYKAMGTSYQGDFVWYPSQEGSLPVSKRFGSFMNPVSKIKTGSELLLFYESRFGQAFLSTQEVIDAGTLGDNSVAVDVPGWHGKLGEFNATFCDGSGRKVKCTHQGDMMDIVTQVDPATNPYRNGMLRGNGTNWRYDNFPYADYNENTLSDW